MPMQNQIKQFIDSRGMTVYQFWQETGISRTTAYNLYNNPRQYPARDVMDAICTKYKVQPGELLAWIPDDSSVGDAAAHEKVVQSSVNSESKSEHVRRAIQMMTPTTKKSA